MSQPNRPAPRRPTSSFSTIGGLIGVVFTCAMILTLLRSPEEGVMILIGLFAAFILLIGPITALGQLKKDHFSGVDSPFEAFDPRDEGLPPRVVVAIEEFAPRIEALGFVALGHCRLSGAVNNVDGYVTLFENRRARQTARLVTSVVVKPRVPQVQGTTSLVFHTEFTDGTKLATANNATPTLQPPLRMREGSMSFPWIRDPARLHEIHEASVARYAGDGIRVDTAITDPVEYLRRSRREETEKHVETGYYYLDEDRRRYRPTWKGAILMTVKQLPPVGPIRRVLRRRKARRMLRELGLDRRAAEQPGRDPATLSR